MVARRDGIIPPTVEACERSLMPYINNSHLHVMGKSNVYPIYTVMTIEFGNILSAININLNNFESRIESKHFKTSALECATFVSACTRVPTSVFEHTALFNFI